MLMRRPRYGFYSSKVTRELCLRCLAVLYAPNKKLVVIASRCKLLLIETPLEAAYLLLMPDQLSLKVIFRPQISVEYSLISGACAQKPAVPSNTPHSSIMASKLLNHLALSSVPDL